MGKCILIGAGDLTMGELSVTEEDYVIAVDGGLSYCGILNVEPDLIIGDFDSMSEQEKLAVEQLQQTVPEKICRLPECKDDTDMLAAIKRGLELGYNDFRIYAATGGRFDHTLANIQCLLYLKNHGAVGYLVDGTGMVLVLQNEAVHFRKELEGTMSLFALTKEAKGVNIRGMKYPLENAVITNDFPIGISNEFLGEEAEVSVEDGELVCMTGTMRMKYNHVSRNVRFEDDQGGGTECPPLCFYRKKIFRIFRFSVGEIRNYKLESETDRGEDPLGRMRQNERESWRTINIIFSSWRMIRKSGMVWKSI